MLFSLLSLATGVNVLTPPRGWNSWDSFQGNLDEKGATEVAENMVKYLLPAGYDTLTIDEFWYVGDCAAGQKCLDDNGRPQPDVSKWPSSADGKGFKPFADKMHKMGLKVGIHTLRGSISQEAINQKAPVLGGGGVTVDQLATTACTWNRNWYGVNMSHPAAQIWLDSVYGQYGDWGIDLIKNDCIFAGNMIEDNIKAVSAAIAKSGHPTTYSLSPGGGENDTEFEQAKSIASSVNIYRVTDDWHGGNMDYHFNIAETMQPLIGVQGLDGLSFPDLDMLNPYTNAYNDTNFRAQMTLWSIARSPLIYGADIRDPKLTAEDFILMTNPGMLAISENSTSNRPVVAKGSPSTIVWTAAGTNSLDGSVLVAFIKQKQVATTATVTFDELRMPGAIKSCKVLDIWTGNAVADAVGSVMWDQPGGTGYDGGLFELTACM